MKRLLLVRHGESEWNAVRRLQGQANIALSPRGRDQARALAPLIAAQQPDLVLTSDLVRAAETAHLLGYPDAEREPGLREHSVGAWTGQVIADIKAREEDNYLAWRAGTYAPPEGELWCDMRTRIGSAMMRALERTNETALLVCHGGVIRAALDYALGLEPARIIPVGPASLTILAFPDGLARLEAFNVTGSAPILDAPD
ncbi:histidine phosphatase family protein [Aureimonas fodinaquatilis]|uniref:Histidine phosphatase family protein n=1 Tax=Aureimonas fodinaquatilis TaxID=2565783 RepID=A0A5B0DTE7_9HYPH|nr:histidine phosphatase family protein [Aureimonas fodinaquatilis]KAA0969688.1 histidine phosphatase family protein [Aureimonas fodinaquatilis]